MAAMDLAAAVRARGGDMTISSVSTKLPMELLLTQWAQTINQLIKNPILQGYAIDSIVLDATTPTDISIGLNRKQQGWFIIDNMASCNVWRTQPFNSTTLTLEASAATTISIWVF